MRVAKFGGTSVADKNAIERLADAVLKDEEIKVIAVSAGGKTGGAPKVTDALIGAFRDIRGGMPPGRAMKEVENRIYGLIGELKLNLFDFDLHEMIGRGYGDGLTFDFLLSRGEYVWSKIAAAYLGRAFVDAAEIMKFGPGGAFDAERSARLIRRAYDERGPFVTGGFYGSDQSGAIRLFDRGGGDFTGAVLAAALDSDYVNYTDVNGIYALDPRYFGRSEALREISFRQLAVMAKFGMSVLHPDSVVPLAGTGLTITVKNTFDPLFPGTVVSENAKGVFACAVKSDCIYVESSYPLIVTEKGEMASESEDGIFRSLLDTSVTAVKALTAERGAFVVAGVYAIFLADGAFTRKACDEVRRSAEFVHVFAIPEGTVFVAGKDALSEAVTVIKNMYVG